MERAVYAKSFLFFLAVFMLLLRRQIAFSLLFSLILQDRRLTDKIFKYISRFSRSSISHLLQSIGIDSSIVVLVVVVVVVVYYVYRGVSGSLWSGLVQTAGIASCQSSHRSRDQTSTGLWGYYSL